MSRPLLRGSLYVAFLLSGAAGLIYEVVWAKYLTLFIGGTAVAHTIVLATFMGGLALGNALFGRLADRAGINRLRLYALLELGIGLVCLLFPTFFVRLADLYVAVGTRTGPSSPFNPFLKTTLAAASLLVPCTFMGGTLPVLTKYIVDSLSGLGVKLSWLYFLNTSGAVAGSLLGGFYVVERWGLEFGMVGTSLVNFAIGGAFYLLGRAKDGGAEPSAATKVDEADPSPTADGGDATTRQARVAFWCIGVAGAMSMLYELVWFRLLVLAVGGTVHSFSIMLTGFIAGIAAGSTLAAWMLRRNRNALALFGLCELGIALTSLLFYARVEALPFAFYRIASSLLHSPETYGLYMLCAVAFAVLLMGIPAALMGAALPLASRVCVVRFDVLGRSVGEVFSFNTLGNVAGALVTGLVLLPLLGLEGTLLLGSIVSGLLGVILLRAWRPAGSLNPIAALRDAVRVGAPVSGSRLWPVALLLVLVLFLPALAVFPHWDPRTLQFGLYRWERRFQFASWQDFKEDRSKVSVLYAKDGLDASLLVEERASVTKGAPGERIVRVNGKPDASTGGDLPTQLFVAHLGMFLHPDPRRVMVVGLGSGATAGATLKHSGADVDVAEISPEMVEAARHFTSINNGVLASSHARVSVLDAREFLLLTRESYDVIVSEPTNIWIPGVSMLFTQDFYEIVKRRLRPGGVFTQWLQLYSTDRTVAWSVVSSLTRTFPYVSLWIVGQGDVVFLASDARPRVDPRAFAERFRRADPAGGMLAFNPGLRVLGDPALFLANQVATDEALRLMSAQSGGRPYRDLFPRMEFAAARAQFVGRPYLLLNELDERTGKVASEPLFLEEYLKELPLETGRVAEALLQLGAVADVYGRLGSALALRSLGEGKADQALLSLSEDLAARVTLGRELGRELAQGNATAQSCNVYLSVQGRVLSQASSVFWQPPTDEFESRVDTCMARNPTRADEFGARSIVLLASAGATSRALARFDDFVARGGLTRLHPGDRGPLLVQAARLRLRMGDRARAMGTLDEALRSSAELPEALALREAIRKTS